MNLALFDLDGTLLSGDSDLLWCGFSRGPSLLDDEFPPTRRGALRALHRRHGPLQMDFCGFYAEIHAGYRSGGICEARLAVERFLREIVVPTHPRGFARAAAASSRAGDTVVLTNARPTGS
jgi:hypothetical protein